MDSKAGNYFHSFFANALHPGSNGLIGSDFRPECGMASGAGVETGRVKKHAKSHPGRNTGTSKLRISTANERQWTRIKSKDRNPKSEGKGALTRTPKVFASRFRQFSLFSDRSLFPIFRFDHSQRDGPSQRRPSRPDRQTMARCAPDAEGAIRAQAENETQLNRRVELNLAIKKLDGRMAELHANF